MNTFLIPWAQMLAVSEGEGGLFDFNATLPLMMFQFILLTIVLTFICYKPISKVLDDRETFISTNLAEASEKLLKADEMSRSYDEQVQAARTSGQALLELAEKNTKDLVASEVLGARKNAAKIIEQTTIELEAKKSMALRKLDPKISELSQLIKEKLIGKEFFLFGLLKH
jgi:F-type H+-transporting ATPase subunit b